MTRDRRLPALARMRGAASERTGARLAAGLLAAALGVPPAQAQPVPPASRSAASLASLSIEELAEIEVSSVSKRAERLADAPAAVFVITGDELRRAGITSLAEALRLAPNLQVARSRSHTYAISARGFNGESANKLLVMIDGRTVYTPLHSGVFWDAQDAMISDIDRIEVVSGPGGTLWGANAVNGVINVITRSAHETTDTLAHASAGEEVRGGAVRHGWRLGPQAAMRVYARTFRIGNSQAASGADIADDWRRSQAGFRADWGPQKASWTLQGDVHDGRARVPAQPDRDVASANLLLRHQRELAEKSGLQAQVYVDSYRRRQPGFFSERLDTLDIDVQHQLALANGHELVWGGGHREQHDHTEGTPALVFVPAKAKLRLTNVFVQDTLPLGARTRLTLGMKVERNSYTGTELQPNARIAWRASEGTLVWSAVSRAVRTPSRLDRDLFITSPLGRLLGGPRFDSERLLAWEAGIRVQPTPSTTVSVSGYVNRYEGLRSVEPVGGTDFVLGNGIDARTRGIEAWGSVQINPRWQLHAGLNLHRQSLAFNAGSAGFGSPASGINDPEHQLLLRSNWTPRDNLSVDLALRRIGALPLPVVPAYTALDARVGWQFRDDMEVSLVAANLQGGRHAEFGAAAGRSEFGRSLLLQLTWTP